MSSLPTTVPPRLEGLPERRPGQVPLRPGTETHKLGDQEQKPSHSSKLRLGLRHFGPQELREADPQRRKGRRLLLRRPQASYQRDLRFPDTGNPNGHSDQEQGYYSRQAGQHPQDHG